MGCSKTIQSQEVNRLKLEQLESLVEQLQEHFTRNVSIESSKIYLTVLESLNGILRCLKTINIVSFPLTGSSEMLDTLDLETSDVRRYRDSIQQSIQKLKFSAQMPLVHINFLNELSNILVMPEMNEIVRTRTCQICGRSAGRILMELEHLMFLFKRNIVSLY